MGKNSYQHILFSAEHSDSASGELKHAYQKFDEAVDVVNNMLHSEGIEGTDRLMGLTSMYVSQVVNSLGKEETVNVFNHIIESLDSPSGVQDTFVLNQQQKNKLN